jgi:hypothetical protein
VYHNLFFSLLIRKNARTISNNTGKDFTGQVDWSFCHGGRPDEPTRQEGGISTATNGTAILRAARPFGCCVQDLGFLDTQCGSNLMTLAGVSQPHRTTCRVGRIDVESCIEPPRVSL